jgi:ATP-dependent Lhr-like helicase
MRADDLLAATFPDQAACAENLTGPIRVPDHVLVRETIDNCLREAMDVDGLLEILRSLERGEIRTLAIDTPEPSPFCHEILNANQYAFLDDAPLEERRARAVHLRRTLRDDGDGVGLLDAAAIDEVSKDVWPLVRDADELHDALTTLVVVPPFVQWEAWYAQLVADRRATSISVGERRFWVCAERLDLARRAYPESGAEPEVAAATDVLRGWLESTGPASVAELSERLALPAGAIEAALLSLESEGQVLRGRFTQATEQWCNRRVLARIHRLTIGTLRREIEPVSAAEYVRFLYRWQHLTSASRLHGIDGLLQVIRQLEGYEAPAAAWETQILPARIAAYTPQLLDRLCYSGDVMWGRLSPHPALDAAEDRQRRVRPTKLAPISLLLRESADDLVARPASESTDGRALSRTAREVLGAIERLGAPFFADIVRATKRLASEVEEALWQLVAAGCVTADGFDALRSLVDAKRRLGEKGLRARPRASSGRWTLLQATRQRIEPEVFARRLLARWGVVCRDVTARESLAPPWREISHALRRLESRGEVRGGRFIAGVGGEQFAAPEALDALRAARRNPLAEEVRVGDYDPLALAGVILPIHCESASLVNAGSSSIGR